MRTVTVSMSESRSARVSACTVPFGSHPLERWKDTGRSEYLEALCKEIKAVSEIREQKGRRNWTRSTSEAEHRRLWNRSSSQVLLCFTFMEHF